MNTVTDTEKLAQALRDQFWTDIVIAETGRIFKRYRLDFRLINGASSNCMDLPLFKSEFDARLVSNAISEAYRSGKESDYGY